MGTIRVMKYARYSFRERIGCTESKDISICQHCGVAYIKDAKLAFKNLVVAISNILSAKRTKKSLNANYCKKCLVDYLEAKDDETQFENMDLEKVKW